MCKAVGVRSYAPTRHTCVRCAFADSVRKLCTQTRRTPLRSVQTLYGTRLQTLYAPPHTLHAGGTPRGPGTHLRSAFSSRCRADSPMFSLRPASAGGTTAPPDHARSRTSFFHPILSTRSTAATPPGESLLHRRFARSALPARASMRRRPHHNISQACHSCATPPQAHLLANCDEQDGYDCQGRAPFESRRAGRRG